MAFQGLLFGGVEIRWRCASGAAEGRDDVLAEGHLSLRRRQKDTSAAAVLPIIVHRTFPGKSGSRRAPRPCEWPWRGRPTPTAFCPPIANTIPTQDGGTHEAGMAVRCCALEGSRERVGQGKRPQSEPRRRHGRRRGELSVFRARAGIPGQTKDTASTAEAQRSSSGIKGPIRHWLSRHSVQANRLLDFVIERADERCAVARAGISRTTGEESAPARASFRLHETEGRLRKPFIVGALAPRQRQRRRATARQSHSPVRGTILNVGRRKGPAHGKCAARRPLAGDRLRTGAHYRAEDCDIAPPPS